MPERCENCYELRDYVDKEKICDECKKTTWYKMKEIIDRLGAEVQWHPPDPTFYYFKFDVKPNSKNVEIN